MDEHFKDYARKLNTAQVILKLYRQLKECTGGLNNMQIIQHCADKRKIV